MKNNLQKLRKQSKLSQTDLAKMLGVTRQAISLYEQGKRQLKEKDINTLIKYFNVSKKYLLGATTYEVLDPLEKSIYDHVTVAMDRVFNEYAILPVQKERVLKAIAYSIDNGDFN